MLFNEQHLGQPCSRRRFWRFRAYGITFDGDLVASNRNLDLARFKHVIHTRDYPESTLGRCQFLVACLCHGAKLPAVQTEYRVFGLDRVLHRPQRDGMRLFLGLGQPARDSE